MTSLLAQDPLLYIVLWQIGLLLQLYEKFLLSNERTVVSLQLKVFSFTVKFQLFLQTTKFYCTFLRHSLSLSK